MSHRTALGKLAVLVVLGPGSGFGLTDQGDAALPVPSPKGCPSQRAIADAPRPTSELVTADLVVTVNGNLQWVVNGAVNPALTLTRGHTYLFDLTAFNGAHPFVINDQANNPFGAVFAGPASGQVISFTPDASMASTIYYHCEVHYGSMAGTINLLSPCVGDLNNDHTVNSIDFALFVNAFGTTCGGCAADLNGNGQVNSIDFALFVNAFGSNCE